MDEKTVIIKKISQLRCELYGDNKNNLSEQEKLEKTKLLNNYEIILTEISKENNISLSKKQFIKIRRTQLSEATLDCHGSKVKVKGIYSFIQDSDEQFYDSIVIYKGYSMEYNIDFLAYVKENTNTITIIKIINIYGYLIAQPITDNEMIESLTVQCLDEMDNFKDFTTIPYIIGCIKEKEKKNDKQDTQQESKQTIEISDSKKIDKKIKMYYYKTKLPWYDNENCTRNLFKYIKEEPELFINVDCLHSMKEPTEIVLSFSVPMEQLGFDERYWTKGKEEWLNFLSQYIGEKVDENYLSNKFNPDFIVKNFSTKEKLMFIYDLNQTNPNAYVKETDENEKCRITSKIPLPELKTEKTWLFFIDRDGYIVRSSQKLSKYSFNFFQKDFQEIDSINLEQTDIDNDPFFNATEIPNYIDECIVNKKYIDEEKSLNSDSNSISSNNNSEEQNQIQMLLEIKEKLIHQNSLLAKQNEMLLDELNLMKKQMQSMIEQQRAQNSSSTK